MTSSRIGALQILSASLVKRLSATALAVLSFAPAAQAELSTRMLTVMIDDGTGASFSTGTLVGDRESIHVVIPERLQAIDTLCVRLREGGNCFAATTQIDLPGLGLSVALVESTMQLWRRESEPFFAASMAMPDWVIADGESLSQAEPTWIGRDDFADWRQPLQPARISGVSDTGFTIAHPDLGPLDEGAALFDPMNGLIGVIARAADGRAGVVGSRVLFKALLATGLEIPPEWLPTARDSDLPPDVESEIGGFWVFFHYPNLPDYGFSAFYGPGPGGSYGGWGANFDTSVLYRVYSLDGHMRDGRTAPEYLSGSDTRQTFGGSGWNLDAPYPGATPDVLATCAIHSVPSAADRRVYNLTFWRQRAEGSFDQVAFSEKGWADDENACVTAMSGLGDVRGIINGSTDRTEAAQVSTAPAEDEFELVSDPVSIQPSAIARIDDLLIGVTCGPGGQPFVFFRSASDDAPHLMVDVYQANLENWSTWTSSEETTFIAPMHPDAARGTVYGAGVLVTYQGRTSIVMGGYTSVAAETALAQCL